MDYYSGDDYTNLGINFVKQSNGSVYSSGTATGQARYYWLYQAKLPAGKYKIGGMPEDASESSFRLQYSINGGVYVTFSSTTDIIINNGDIVNVRSWYKDGYIDEGHTWNVFIGIEEGSKNSKNNPKYFIPLIYQNMDNIVNLENLEGDIDGNTSAIDRINRFIKWEYFDTVFEIGSLLTSGNETESTTRVRSGYIETKDYTLNVAEGYRFAVHYYDTNSSKYSSDKDYWLDAEYTLKTEYSYFRYVVEKIPAVTVQQSEIETYGNSVRIDNETVLTKTIDSINERVTEIEQIDALPDYWESYLETKIPQINNEIYNIGNHGIVFTFFTDYHYIQSEYNYQGFTWLPRILKRIKQQCPIENFIFGGDILTNNGTRAEAVTILKKFREDYNFLNLKNINGNHETNPYGGEPVTINDIYSILFRGMGMEESVNLNPDLYWYYDNEPQKVRIIALNTGEGIFNDWILDTDQHKWFVDTLAATPSGYTVIIIPHVFFKLSDGSLFVNSIGENIQSIVDAYAIKVSGVWNTTNYDFTNADGEVACILCGHTHNDGMIKSQTGYPMISIVCDAMWGSQQNTVRGTSAQYSIAEHAFDVICVDTEAKTIKCLRVGSGVDRIYSYGIE